MKTSFLSSFLLPLFLVSTLSLKSQEKANTVLGTVTDGQTPLSDVSILIKGTDNGTTTDSWGRYAIQASPKSILVFSHIGMEAVEIILEDVTKVLNIEMLPRTEKLDEVVVTKKKRNTQENLAKNYFSDATIVNTNFGYLSPETVGYELRVIDGKNLRISSRDILSAIAEQLPGVTIVERQGERFLYMMSYGSLRKAPSAAYEIDGHIDSIAPVWLDIELVLRIAIIPPKQAVYRYGKIGSGGMIVINTTGVNNGLREDGGRPYDLARLRGNVYSNEALDPKEVLENGPAYLKEFYESNGIEEARLLYKKHKKIYGSSYAFVLDAYCLFHQHFSNADIANVIIAENAKIFEENPIALKALAYHYQAQGEFMKANAVYEKVFKLRPDYAQSYLDLASSYQEIGNFKKSVSMYSRYDYLVKENLLKVNDSTLFSLIMNRELDNLVSLHGKEILSEKEFSEYIVEDDFNGTRLVFEWNDSESEFELQFVNPKGHYHISEHSLFADPDRIREEKLAGYSCEEFLIDESLPGTWQVNAKYLGNKSLTPSYLKTTIYYDYGSAAQRKETKVFKLGLKNVNQELFKIQNTASITSN